MIVRLALYIGAAAGLLYTAALFLSYRSGISALSGFLSGYALLPVVLLLVGAGAIWLRKNERPVPEVRDLIKYAFLAYAIFEVIYAIANLTLFRWVAPTANDEVLQFLLASTEKKFRDGGGSQEKLDEIRKMADSAKGPMSYTQVLIGMGQQLIVDFLKSLFIATITKQTIQPKP